MEAEFPNGEIDTLRLLGVDTPETTYSRVSPEEFEGIPDTVAGGTTSSAGASERRSS